MKFLSFKTKILLLVVVPLVFVSVALTLLSINQANKLGSKNVDSFSNMIFDLRRGELKNYTELAITAVKHVYFDQGLNDVDAQEEAKKILRNLEFGEDGYFFVYDYAGMNIAHPKKPQLEGKKLWNLQDSSGVYLIRSLIEEAKKPEGGYTNYIWDKPSKNREVGKIGYSMSLDNWRWMVGTGLYIDDLEEAVSGIEAEVKDNIRGTLEMIAGLALACTLVVGFIGVRFTMSESKLADQHLQQLSRKAVTGQEEERSRVARDLQKDINQSLIAARAKLHDVAKFNSLENEAARKSFSSAVTLLNQTIKDVYRISGELRPEMLDRMGLYAAAEALVEKVSSSSDVEISFKKTVVGERLREEIETALYRIIQEGLNNIVNHSQSSIASVRIRQTNHSIGLMIQDNGIGFNSKNTSKLGVGFADMRVRAEALGGTFSVFSSGGIGTIVKIEVPL
jgi:two-component system, NarL family, sensor kinase